MARARDLGAAELRAAGLSSEAAALAEARTPPEVRRAGHEGSASAQRAGAIGAARASYGAGTAGQHMAAAPSTPHYLTFPAFAAYAAAVVADTVDPETGYEEERRRQADWLASRLDLPRN
jgi:hypothetical protein